MTKQAKEKPSAEFPDLEKLRESYERLLSKFTESVKAGAVAKALLHQISEGDPYIAMRLFQLWVGRYLDAEAKTPEERFGKILKALAEYSDEQFQIEMLSELSSHGLSLEEYAEALSNSGKEELTSTLKSFWQHGFQRCFGMFTDGLAFRHIARSLEGVDIMEQEKESKGL